MSFHFSKFAINVHDLTLTKALFAKSVIQKKLRNFKAQLIVNLLFNSKFGKRKAPQEDVILELVAGNFLSSDGIENSSSIYRNWHKADYFFGRGNYWSSFKFRKSCIEEVYKLQDVSVSNPFVYPIFVSSSYTVAIGHLGALYLNNLAEQLGILPKGPRYVLVGNRVANSSALDFVAKNQIRVGKFDPSSILLLSNFIENYQMVKCKEGFLDRYQLWEKVFYFTNHLEDDFLVKQKKKNSVNLDEGRDTLKRRSVDLDAPIALVHLRNNGIADEVRNVKAQSYVECILRLQSLGYQVCQIGVNRHNSISKIVKGVFEFSGTSSADKQADFYLMLNSDIFIGTTSGPAIFPTLFGVPSLITNLTSISRNAFGSKSTLYVPKIIVDSRGKPLNLQEQFSSRFAFGGEFLRKQLKRSRVDFKDVSNQELLESLEELLSRIKNGKLEKTTIDARIAEIRADAKSVSSGLISNSFLSAHFNL